MFSLPYSDKALIIRTDFSKESKWKEVCAAINDPSNAFQVFAEFIDEPKFKDADIKNFPKFSITDSIHGFALVVDAQTSLHPEFPILCVDLDEEFGRTFRVIPKEVWSVSANLALSNMDFYEFADNVDNDGIFRGFKPLDIN